MRTWQWAYIMWILAMICFYIDGKQSIFIFAIAIIFISIGTGSLLNYIYLPKKESK